MSCCSSTKSNTNSENTNTAEMETKQMMEEGYKMGVIVTSREEGDCPITIQILDEETYLLDPINIAEMYKIIDGDKVWVKYTGLRMMNRCEKANPVSLTEIKKRLE
jgi:hypothetical protein